MIQSSQCTGPRTAESAYTQRFESLQVFRGLAALAVVLFHVACFMPEKPVGISVNALMPGCSGVDFFFVLSGFIIYNVHRKDFARPAKLLPFVRKRLIRIYPLYLLITAVMMLLYSAHFGHSGKLNATVILKSLLLFPQSPGVRPLVNTGWTLCHEILFYSFFGLFIRLRIATSNLLLMVLGLLTILNCFLPLPGPYWIRTWLFSPYNLEFFAGCLASSLVSRKVDWAFPVGLLCLTVTWSVAVRYSLPLGDGAPLWMVCLFGIPFFLIVLGAASLERRRSLRAPAILISIGDATYSIYLSHFVLASALTPALIHTRAAPILVVMTTSLICTLSGYAIYRILEAPMLSWMQARTLHVESPPTSAVIAHGSLR